MKKTKILFEGHDLKFLSHVIGHYRQNHHYHVDVFTYDGHVIKDLREVKRILPDIDIIFCEWGLGNLQWFSHNKLPGQKIVTRIHSQEFSTPFLADTKWENVDNIIVVGPYMKQRFDRLFPGISEKCQVITNMIDVASFKRDKDEDARFNLGLLGILPMSKAPHLGLEILKELRKIDSRYKLFIKGRRPEEVDWLWKRPEEQVYYNNFYSNIEKMGLGDAVILEPQGNDVQEWFRHIGFVISPSEFESFHMAIAEGMASRAIPVIRNWEGSLALFPGKYSIRNVTEAVALVRKYTLQKDFEAEGMLAQQYCTEHFDVNVILPEYDKLLIPAFNLANMRRDYIQTAELLKKLNVDIELCTKAKEKVSGDFGILIQQQKTLTESNSGLVTELAAELAQRRKTTVEQQEITRKLSENLLVFEKDLSSLRETLQSKLGELDKIKVDLHEQTTNNKSLREEIILQQQENLRIKDVLSAENTNIRQSLERENQFIHKMYQDEKVQILTNSENEKKRLHEICQTSTNGLAKEILALKSEHQTTILRMEQERMRLQVKMDHLKNINLDLERRLIQTFSSLTWKVGALLVKKPMDLVIWVKRKLFSVK